MLEIRGGWPRAGRLKWFFATNPPLRLQNAIVRFFPVIKTMTRSFCEPSAAICGKNLPGVPTLISEALCHQGDVSIEDSGTGTAKRCDRGVKFPGI
jgi:hypothetical protein